MFKRTLVPIFIVATLAAPTAASAATEWGPPLNPAAPAWRAAAYLHEESTPTAAVAGEGSGGFDWGDAGIGAAVALGASAAGGALVLPRRRPAGGSSA